MLNGPLAKKILLFTLPVALSSSVNSFGSTAIAGSAVALNFEYFTYYAITAFGQTATTFVGQNYAAKKYDRCKKNLAVSRLFAFVKCPDDRADRAFPPRLFGAFFRRAARHRERVRPHFVYSCLRADLQFL